MKKIPYFLLLTVFLSGCKIAPIPGGLPDWTSKIANTISTALHQIK
ncbi:MAG: hypothetical protein JWN78_1956 [Bacteroidota bacterium]|nr:hypothetical protein [Bacteroidota bacterium]